MLRGPVQRIWDGERDAQSLTAGLDDQEIRPGCQGTLAKRGRSRTSAVSAK